MTNKRNSVEVEGWTICETDGWNGRGHYAWPTEHPDEGSLVFETREDAVEYAEENSLDD